VLPLAKYSSVDTKCEVFNRVLPQIFINSDNLGLLIKRDLLGPIL
jgi:hypothetical protein